MPLELDLERINPLFQFRIPDPKKEYNPLGDKLYNKMVLTSKIKNISPFTSIYGVNKNFITDRRDRFTDGLIQEEIQRIGIPPVRLGLGEQPRQSITKNSEFFYSTTGLKVISSRLYPGETARVEGTIEGKPISFEDNQYSEIHFMPLHGRSKMTENMLAGIRGILEMLDAIDQGKVNLPPTFVGRTNRHMATIAQRMGFVIIDQCKTPQGKVKSELDRYTDRYTVVGKLEDIRKKVEEFRRFGANQILENRAKKLSGVKLTPQLAGV